MPDEEEVTVQWVAGALAAAKRELNILALLDDAAAPKTLVALLGADFAQAVVKLRQAQRAYDIYVEEQEINEENMGEFQRLRKGFIRAFQKVQQLQRRHPEKGDVVADNFGLASVKSEENWATLAQQLVEYFDLVHERLVVISEGREQPWTRQDAMSTLRASRMSAQTRRAELEETLGAEELQRDTVVSQYSAKIRKLETEIERLQSLTATNERNIRETDKEERRILDETHAQTVQALNAEIEKCVERLAKKTEEHQEAEQGMKKKVKQVQLEIDTIVGAYDKEIIDLAKKVDGLQKQHDVESARLAELQDKVHELKTEREEWEDQLAEAQRQKERQDKARERAATTLQANFRGFRVRKDMAKGKKGGKKRR